MKYKIAFFDIDGTLLDIGAKGIAPRVEEALHTLQQRGCKIFIATGRAPYSVPQLGRLAFDGALCFNGSYGRLRQGEVIFSRPIDGRDVRTVVENARRLGLPVLAATAQRMGCNFYQEELAEYMAIAKEPCHVMEDYDAFLGEDIYQMMVGATAERDGALLRGTSAVKITRWWDRAMDIIPADAGKARGMEKVLAHFGWGREDAIAFGDGGNDLDMIAYAGMGVAMGNAVAEVKAAADYVTDDCAHDGVYAALRHLAIL